MPGRQVFHPAVADVGRHVDYELCGPGGEAAGFLDSSSSASRALRSRSNVTSSPRSSPLQLLDELQAVDMSTSVT
jgi:hypothetical protein